LFTLTQEILERLKLWRVAALLIKFCYRPKISQLSNEVIMNSFRALSSKSTAGTVEALRHVARK
jgi:hypothetical protein